MLFLKTFKDEKFVLDFTLCIEISDVASGHFITQPCTGAEHVCVFVCVRVFLSPREYLLCLSLSWLCPSVAALRYVCYFRLIISVCKMLVSVFRNNRIEDCSLHKLN